MGSVVVLRHGNAVAEKTFTVLPMVELTMRQRRGACENDDRDEGSHHFPETPTFSEFPCCPDNRDEAADKRDVCVPVGHKLIAHLNQPDNRHQRSEKPKPANSRPGMPATHQYAKECDASQHYDTQPDLPKGPPL